MTGPDRRNFDYKVSVDNVWKLLGNRWVLRGVNLVAGSEDAILIIGVNGSGKTTLLKIIAGLMRPSKGRVSLKCDSKNCVGFSGHTPSLYPTLTIEENIRFFTLLHGLKRPSPTALEAWHALDLDSYRSTLVAELSYGWRKRTDIVRALVGDPEIILLDEPFSGLDSHTALKLELLINSLLERGKIVIATTPRLDEHYSRIKWNIYNLEGGLLAGH